MTIEALLKRKNLEGSLVNQYGEGVVLGAPETVKHLKYEYSFTWKVDSTKHKSPFDTLILHEGDKILTVIPTSMVRIDGNIRSLTIHMA